MRGDKIVIYENCLHQRAVFDQKYLFCESIDMTGTAGVHFTEQPALADGQAIVFSKLSAKTVPCSFAFKNTKDDSFTKTMLENIFNPKCSGTLTVITKNHTYELSVRPQNQPTFKRDMVKFVYRFDVDFVSESSLWKMDSEITVPLTAAETTLLSENPHDLPIKIVFPNCNSSTLFNVNGKGFTLKPHTMPLTVDTQTFKTTDNQGTNQNRYIDATAQLDEVYIRFGENKIICSPFADVQIFYYQLSNGEM